ncbi:MAG: hypothetical protein AAGK71_09950 [Pseudomonadota bacterium]
MTKHVIDHPRPADSSRLSQQFARIEADEKPRPQSAQLQKRARTTPQNSRLKAFTKIARRDDS